MMNVFTWIVSLVCLAGTILNVKRNILCFHLWALGNAAWLIYDISCGLFSRAIVDVVQFGCALWGLYECGKDE